MPLLLNGMEMERYENMACRKPFVIRKCPKYSLVIIEGSENTTNGSHVKHTMLHAKQLVVHENTKELPHHTCMVS